MNKPIETRYLFKQKETTPTYDPDRIEYSFYQICSYPTDGMYHVRKIIYNEKLDVVTKFEKYYPKKKIEKFISKTPEHKYQLYPTPTLNLVSYPNPEQIIAANSSLLR